MNIIKNFSDLLKEPKLIDDLPIVIRVRKFDETAAKDFTNWMQRAQNSGQPVVPVIIDSYGGQVYSLMSMISDIKHSKVPVATIVQRPVHSSPDTYENYGRKRDDTPERPRRSQGNCNRLRHRTRAVLLHRASNWARCLASRWATQLD